MKPLHNDGALESPIKSNRNTSNQYDEDLGSGPASRPPYHLPNFLAIKPRRPPLPHVEGFCSSDLAITKPFPLQPPPYTDEDVPLPEPYNPAYPHPLTAYASPGVNPATVRKSGYAEALVQLFLADPDKLKGSILATSEHRDAVVPALAMHNAEGDGNGIPERLWARFESFGAARLPVGVAGVSPFARSSIGPTATPPRFNQAPPTVFGIFDEAKFSHYAPHMTDNTAMASIHGSGLCSDRLSSASFTDPCVRHALSTNEMRGNDGSFYPDMRSRHSYALASPASEGLRSYQDRSYQILADTMAFRKTELCKDWVEYGTCKYGMQCQVNSSNLVERSALS